MPRYFTLTQAQALLPNVETVIREAVVLRAEFQLAEGELQASTQKIMMMGGSLVDRDRLSRQKSRRDSSATKLKEAIEQIHSLGCLIKDLDIGLVDFPTQYRGEEVYLCWKLGEDRIQFWHGVTEGFQGRKKIDHDFLHNHKGDLPN
jgi:hypothetical protein